MPKMSMNEGGPTRKKSRGKDHEVRSALPKRLGGFLGLSAGVDSAYDQDEINNMLANSSSLEVLNETKSQPLKVSKQET